MSYPCSFLVPTQPQQAVGQVLSISPHGVSPAVTACRPQVYRTVSHTPDPVEAAATTATLHLQASSDQFPMIPSDPQLSWSACAPRHRRPAPPGGQVVLGACSAGMARSAQLLVQSGDQLLSWSSPASRGGRSAGVIERSSAAARVSSQQERQSQHAQSLREVPASPCFSVMLGPAVLPAALSRDVPPGRSSGWHTSRMSPLTASVDHGAPGCQGQHAISTPLRVLAQACPDSPGGCLSGYSSRIPFFFFFFYWSPAHGDLSPRQGKWTLVPICGHSCHQPCDHAPACCSSSQMMCT